MGHCTYLNFSYMFLVILVEVGSVETGSVDKLNFSLVKLETCSDAIPCGMGNVGDNNSLLSNKLVDES